jgi:ABC-2 type transport system ATP-binding protein
MAILRLDDVSKEYGRVKAVQGLSLELKAGELVGLVGPNGAGKSTTIQMLAGQLLPTGGTIEVQGVDVLEHPGEARKHIGYVPEEPRLYDYLSAREMLEFVVDIRGSGDVNEALELTGLGSDAERLIREYSQGMRRKTALACAMVSKPPLLVLDEALNGLDPPSALRVGDALRQACVEGATVLLSTHVLETLERLADRVVMIECGQIVADLPATEIDTVRERFRTLR